VALLACMTLVAGGAVASDSPPRGSARAVSASGVAALQRALGVSADGVIGPVTRRAIRNYQRNHGLDVDGIAGPATLSSLGISARTVRTVPSAVGASAGTLSRIARCESGGNPGAISSTGQYRGKYQFSRATWRDLGGSGDPAAAPESVQDAMAAKLLAQRGTSPWPVCG
jgi:peptidoglycan hydrolase-like protein with peptidoglycan-binding domain